MVVLLVVRMWSQTNETSFRKSLAAAGWVRVDV
jgi:hypothetical protein